MREKSSRTSAQRKIGSQLIFAAKIRRGEPIAEGVDSLRVDLDINEGGSVLVDIEAKNVTDAMLSDFEESGCKVINSFPAHGAIRAWVPLPLIELLAEREDVISIRPAVKGYHDSGTIVSEGDATHGADAARSTYGARGAGVKIGVLSDSLNYLDESQASGDLPEIIVLPGQAGPPEASGEGTAMLEIIHDLAPEAELFFATAEGGPFHFAENIRALRDAGCDIIVDDIRYAGESPFQDGIVAQAVDEVASSGVLYFTSAGNSGNKKSGLSGTWEGDFVNGGSFEFEEGTLHSFGSETFNTVSSSRGHTPVNLFWADPLDGSENDYDIFVLDASGSEVRTASSEIQDGRQDPFEFIRKVFDEERIVIVKSSGENRFLHLGTGGARLAISTGGNVRGHDAASGAISVAAVRVGESFPHTFHGAPKNSVERFSSDGPRRVFFTPDGRPITPGDFSSSGGELRQKPDIAAANGVATSVPGFERFFGTSAAAPHAAAIAALVKSYNTALTPKEIRDALLRSALDIEAPGPDVDSGHGIVMALRTLESIPKPALPTVSDFQPASGSIGDSITITGTKLETVASVSFSGTSAHFYLRSDAELVATVPPGVISGPITLDTSAGPVITSMDFDVSPSPTVTRVEPQRGATGSTVSIYGVNFSSATSVTLDGSSADFTIESDTLITAIVPTGISEGNLSVTSAEGTASIPGAFTVTTSPHISRFDPASAPSGSTVRLFGSNFSEISTVKLNEMVVDFDFHSPEEISVVIPRRATSGFFEITSDSQIAVSDARFVVIDEPFIAKVDPSTGEQGSRVVISGRNLNGATAVVFGGVESPSFEVISPFFIVAAVPRDGISGPVAVTTPGGTSESGRAFELMAAPSNDNLAEAQILSEVSGTVSGSNLGAIKETDEPNHGGNPGGKSIWYRWTAPVSGAFRFDTIGSQLDTLLAIYQGDTYDDLRLVAGNDDNDNDTISQVTFVAEAGQAYLIAVDGFNGSSGNAVFAESEILILNWQETTEIPAIRAVWPESGAAGSSVTITGANFLGATVVEFGGRGAAFSIHGSEQLTAIVPLDARSGSITVMTPGGTTSSIDPFEVLDQVNNDDFENAVAISGSSGSRKDTNRFATLEEDEPLHAGNAGGRSFWYLWSAPETGTWTFNTEGSNFDTIVAIYAGDSLGNLALVAEDDDSGPDLTSSATFSAETGIEYRIAVDGAGGHSGDISLNWRLSPEIPEIADIHPVQGSVGESIVITGTRLGSVTDVTFNGLSAQSFVVDSESQITATIPTGAVSGPIELVTQSGVVISDSEFTLVSRPANDQFANAQTLDASAILISGETNGATKETGEPVHTGTMGGRSVWYHWTPPDGGTWTVDTSGSDFDTLLAVYTGTSVSDLSTVVSDDDSGNGFTSKVTFAAERDTIYHIAIDGFGGDEGSLQLRIYPDAIYVAPLVLYSTGFEASEGYKLGLDLVGQQGWLREGGGGGGILSGLLPDHGQHAYVGLDSPPAFRFETFVWRPINHNPDIPTRPIIKFSVLMEMVASTNSQYDVFQWAVLNQDSDELFSLGFSNLDLQIYYVLDDATGPTGTGVYIANDRIYELTISMDFERNRWGASIDHTPVVMNKPITAVGSKLNMGRIAAAWLSLGQGDNYLLFDDYEVRAEARRELKIHSHPSSRTETAATDVSFRVVASGGELLLYQWRKDEMAIPGATAPIFFIANLEPEDAGRYSVVVSDGIDTITSEEGVLEVGQPSLAVPPENDDPRDSINLQGASVQASGTNTDATLEMEETDLRGGSVWWTWLAPATAEVTIDTDGSDFDTTLAVFTDSPESGLILLEADDDGGRGANSRVEFEALEETLYHIAVSGSNGASGTISLSIEQEVISPEVDLALANLTPSPLTIIAGESLEALSYELINAGTAMFDNDDSSFQVELFLSTDDIFGNSDDQRIGSTEWSGGSLEAGDRWMMAMDASSLREIEIPANSLGEYFVFARLELASSSGQIDSTEANDYTMSGEPIMVLKGEASDNLWSDAVTVNGGWRWVAWFGFWNDSFLPWIFHVDHGWVYIADGSRDESLWLFDLALGWLYTTSTVYPSLYGHELEAWIFYFQGTSSPREFVNLISGEFFAGDG